MATFRCDSPDPHLVLGVRRGASLEEIEWNFRIRERGHHLDALGIIEPEEVGLQVFLIKRSYNALKKAALTGCEVESVAQRDDQTHRNDQTHYDDFPAYEEVMKFSDTDSDTVVKMEDMSPSEPNVYLYPEYNPTDGNADAGDDGNTQDDSHDDDVEVVGTRSVKKRKRSSRSRKRKWRGYKAGAARHHGQRPAGWVGVWDSDTKPQLLPSGHRHNKKRDYGRNHYEGRRGNRARGPTWGKGKYN